MVQSIVITLAAVFFERALACEGSKDLDLCLDNISHLMPEDRGLPYDKDKVDNYCFSFNSGLKCVDSFTSKCLTPEKKAEFEKKMDLQTQRTFMKFLCTDDTFQKTYLSHKKCLMLISDDWYTCIDKVNILLDYQEQNGRMNFRNELANLCCIREIFFQCIYKKTYQKCSKKSVLFLRKVTATLLYGDGHISECRNYTMERCTSDEAQISARVSTSLILITLATVLIVFTFPDVI